MSLYAKFHCSRFVLYQVMLLSVYFIVMESFRVGGGVGGSPWRNCHLELKIRGTFFDNNYFSL